MKTIVLACLLVCLLAVNPLDQYKTLVAQDECAAKTLELIKPEIDAKLAEFKKVKFNLFRIKATSSSKLKSSLLWKRENKCSTSVRAPSPSQFSEMPLKPPESHSFWPVTASRMSELSSSSPILLSKTPRTGPMTPLSQSSFTFSEDKPPRIANNSGTTLYDCLNPSNNSHIFNSRCGLQKLAEFVSVLSKLRCKHD